jgi:hypothetical protein
MLPWNKANRIDFAGIDPLAEIPFSYEDNANSLLAKLYLVECDNQTIINANHIEEGMVLQLVAAISVKPEPGVYIEVEIHPDLHFHGIASWQRIIHPTNKTQFITVNYTTTTDYPGLLELPYLVRLYYRGQQ